MATAHTAADLLCGFADDTCAAIDFKVSVRVFGQPAIGQQGVEFGYDDWIELRVVSHPFDKRTRMVLEDAEVVEPAAHHLQLWPGSVRQFDLPAGVFQDGQECFVLPDLRETAVDVFQVEVRMDSVGLRRADEGISETPASSRSSMWS